MDIDWRVDLRTPFQRHVKQTPISALADRAAIPSRFSSEFFALISLVHLPVAFQQRHSLMITRIVCVRKAAMQWWSFFLYVLQMLRPLFLLSRGRHCARS